MNKEAREFFEALSARLLIDSADLEKFIEEETYLRGEKFSFKGHEYQQYVLKIVKENPGCTFVVKKSSQIGLSEIFTRIVLSKMALRSGTSALISFPSKLMAQEMLKSRVSSVIYESPRLDALLNKNIDSASIKAFLNGSILYALGGSKMSNTSLLNRPISVVLADELDRQDMDIVSGYRSRMTHTPPLERFVAYISTPTAQGLGIDAEFDECRTTHHPFTICNHCGHEFQPDFYKDIKIPGFEESLMLLTKSKAAVLNIDEAYLECPECKKDVDSPTIKWAVNTNELGVKNKIGIELTPFVAYSFISIPDLVESSLTYTSHVEFLNQGLGRTANLKDSAIQIENIKFECKPQVPAIKIYGLDLGKTCHFMSASINPDTTVHIDEAHIVKLSELEDFLTEQFTKTVYTVGVADSQPYSDLIYRLVNKYPHLYSAIYLSPAKPFPELFKLKMTDDFGEVVRQVSINKGPVMDLMASSLENFITFEPNAMQGVIIRHLLDMRRVRDYRFEEMIYQWVKSKKGDDHFFHTLVYVFMASKLALAGVAQTTYSPIFLRTFKRKNC